MVERFFKSLKAREVYKTVYQNQKEAEIALFEYIEGCVKDVIIIIDDKQPLIIYQ